MNSKNRKRFILVVSLIPFIFSCSNIRKENDFDQGRLPVLLSADVRVSNTRILDSFFETGDALGLYVTLQPYSLSDSRYADNIKYTYNSDEFVPEKPLFYPENGEICNFVAYYPYSNEDGKTIEIGSTSLEVSVHDNQSNSDAFSMSDFLVARNSNVVASEQLVHLTFHHKMSRLNIRIQAGEEYTVDELFTANPLVWISGMYTKAIYNFSSDSFSDQNTPADVVPNGIWEIHDGVLRGKSVIVIPQPFSASSVLVELEIDGVFFDCRLNENFIFESGSSNDLTLTVSPHRNVFQPSMFVSVDDWEKEQKIDIAGTTVSSLVSVSNLTFSESSIYHVTTGDGLFVAEICREYLLSDKIESRAVVIYPMIEGQADFSNGFVTSVEGRESENVHGGKVSWNLDGSLTYIAGKSAPIDYVYVTSGGEIITSREENILQLKVHPYVLTDTRSKEACIYPIVKIGRQYWMGENLRTSKYTDGSNILVAENCSDTSSSLYCVKAGFFFYNYEAVSTGMLSPAGWKIAENNTWETLKTYIEDNTSVLKSSLGWKADDKNHASNFTGFNAAVSGLYNSENYLYKDEYSCFWSMSDLIPNGISKSVTLSYSTNTLDDGGSGKALGLSVRCVRQ